MVAETAEYEEPSWARRARSVILLLLLVTVLGALAAGLLGVVVVALTSLVDHALE